MSRPRRPASPTSRRPSTPSNPRSSGPGHRRGRQGQPDLRRAGGQALRRPRRQGYGSVQNAQQAAVAHRRRPCQRRARHGGPRHRDQAARRAQGRARAGAGGAGPRARRCSDQAELNLSYTTIVAPVDGVIGNRTLRVGQYVQAGTQLMAVVPTQAAYIVANYKETQLTNVRPGQPVTIEVDTFPGRVFHGRVDSLAPASGQEFALLPPDNATGNFTKVVQRIPVKITSTPAAALAGRAASGHVGLPDDRHQGRRGHAHRLRRPNATARTSNEPTPETSPCPLRHSHDAGHAPPVSAAASRPTRRASPPGSPSWPA